MSSGPLRNDCEVAVIGAGPYGLATAAVARQHGLEPGAEQQPRIQCLRYGEWFQLLLATGYKIDLAKLRMLPQELRRRISCVNGAPVLGEGFESTVSGLHFVGASAVASYGPLLRSVAGAGFAARSITRIHLSQSAQTKFESLALMESDVLAPRSRNAGVRQRHPKKQLCWQLLVRLNDFHRRERG